MSTFWRNRRSLSIVQSAALRVTVWVLCAYRPTRVAVNIDTTVSTVYGAIEAAQGPQPHAPREEGAPAGALLPG